MIVNLIHFVTAAVQTAWGLAVTHPQVTIPGTLLLVGTMVIVGRKNRVHN